MTKLKFTTITAIAVYAMLAVVFLSGCNDPMQIVYEGDGLIVTGMKVGDKPERGKYIYYTKDQSGDVTIWSNSVFNIGDTLRVVKNYR